MKIIVKAVAGSHLFGLNTENSDKDFKGVFIPSAEEILTGEYPKTIQHKTNPSNTKNTKEDVDVELYSLKKFLSMLEEGQTVAIELLFTPDEFILEKSEEWDYIVSMRDKLVHKGVGAFIGYARTQANRYGIRGSRMGSLEKAVSVLQTMPNHDKLIQHIETLDKHLSGLEHITGAIKIGKDDYYEILGKKFLLNSKVQLARTTLETYLSEYGERSRLAKENSSVDWKAVSHALRVMHQGTELLDLGFIELPLKGSAKDYILSVKKGERDFVTDVQPMIEHWMDALTTAEKISKLPEKIDTKEILIKLHKKILDKNDSLC